MKKRPTGCQNPATELLNATGRAPVLLVCEHAAHFIPEVFDNLGLADKDLQSHVAWDPGALAVAKLIGASLDAKLVASKVSRLLYDCNRPPTSPGAIPVQSEAYGIPGNVGLSDEARAQRIRDYYEPFCDLLTVTLADDSNLQVLVTIHSFTPVYMGQNRAVELGVLHDEDSRLADEMLQILPGLCGLNVQRNQPYGPKDGVTHTLKLHGLGSGIHNVMLEIRNDLITTQDQQQQVASAITATLKQALDRLDTSQKFKAAAC
ncbi:MAG: N-formylglutamate amidohydrolase [Alphaproteobacteria bacterium]|nr:N-formylglutamate amidohydrolase [Alphaproteobacteria bacterium]